MTGPGWMEEAVPPVPESFRPWLEVPSTGGPGGSGGPGDESGGAGAPAERGRGGAWPEPERLERAAMDALGRALAPDGRERGGAFDLLAADAFLTWAAEAALDDEDPVLRLRVLARRAAGAPTARDAHRGRTAHA